MILTSFMRSARRVWSPRTIAALMVVVYLFAGWLTLDAQLHYDSMPSLGCQSIGADAPCMEDMAAHISWWERVFTSTGASQVGIQLLTAIGLLAFLGRILQIAGTDEDQLIRHCAASKDPPEIRFHNYLLAFYSKGTAQPLLYA